MGININDLNNSLHPIGASPLSSNENMLDNIRELSEKELKISGGAGNRQSIQPVSRPVFQPFIQPVFQPVSQLRPFNTNIDINVSSSSISRPNPQTAIVREPERTAPTTISY